MKKAIFLFLLVGLTACGTYKAVSISQAKVDHASKLYPGITLADLNQGKTIFESKCGDCHSLNRPFKVPVSVLKKIMPEMAEKADIDNVKSDLVEKYLITLKTAH